MPTVKVIQIHSEVGINNCLDYVKDQEKTSISNNVDSSSEQIGNVLAYAANEEKTIIGALSNDGDVDILVSGYLCNPKTADDEFAEARAKYYSHTSEIVSDNKKVRTAYHWIQSFDNKTYVDPKLAHQIGIELMEKLGCFQAVINTHMNTDHVHNHIIMNAYNIDGKFKWKDNMTHLDMIRDMSDEIALKYGIPIIIGPTRNQGISWFEWKKKKEGNSWKEQVRVDIDATMKAAASWKEFKQMMESAGYGIRETAHSVTYTLPGMDGLKVRDKTLGEDYLKERLMNYWQNKSIVEEQQYHKVMPPIKVQKNQKIYVSRYTYNGRKRTDLEMIILIAIKIIKKIGDMFRDEKMAKLQPTNPILRLSSWKITQLTDAYNMLRQLGIGNKKDLDKHISETGARLSHLKKETARLKIDLSATTELYSAITDIEDLEEVINKIGVDEDALYIKKYSSDETRTNRAAASSMTPDMRKQLYLLIENSTEYRLNYGMDSITFQEGREAIDYLTGKSANKPDVVITIEEYKKKKMINKYNTIYNNRQEAMKKKYGKEPMTEKQAELIKKLVKEEGLDINISSLSKYDVMNLLYYYKGKNPITRMATEIQKKHLINILYNNPELKINRGIDTITSDEYLSIFKYISNGKTGDLPDVFTDTEPILPSMATRISELAELHGIEIPFNVDELTKGIGNELYNYLLNYKRVPQCITTIPTEEMTDSLFDSYILDYTEKEQGCIVDYRKALEHLAKYGYKKEDISYIKKEHERILSEYEEQKKNKEILSGQYRDLVRLKYIVDLAEDKKFTHGSLYREEIKILETKEPEITAEIEDKPNQNVNENYSFFSVKDEFFENSQNIMKQ